MQYFKNLNTPEEIKSHYRQLAMENHPDRGGDTATMQEINRQYHVALKGIDGREFDERKYTYNAEVEQEVMDKLGELLRLPNLEIALIGVWLWIEGDTKPVKEHLKQAGCIWHSKRRCWYYRPEHHKSWGRGRGDLAAMAWKYGYRNFQSEDRQDQPALTG